MNLKQQIIITIRLTIHWKKKYYDKENNKGNRKIVYALDAAHKPATACESYISIDLDLWFI